MGGRGSGGGYSKTYEDSRSGGKVFTEKGRLDQAKKSNSERQKYEKEASMCKVLAQNGHTIVHLADRKHSDGTYDILIDGHKADLKSTKGANNIGNYAKHATRKQGAELVVFEIKKVDGAVHREINKLSKKGIHGYYYEKGTKKLIPF